MKNKGIYLSIKVRRLKKYYAGIICCEIFIYFIKMFNSKILINYIKK